MSHGHCGLRQGRGWNWRNGHQSLIGFFLQGQGSRCLWFIEIYFGLGRFGDAGVEAGVGGCVGRLLEGNNVDVWGFDVMLEFV